MSDEPTTRRPFHVVVFGGPQLFVGGEVCKISPLQGNLLGLLYGRDSLHVSREEVLSLLWPEEVSAKARRRLNQVIYSLKKKTGEPPPFDSEGEEIRQAPDRVSSDLQSFTSALNDQRFSDCMEQVSKGFLRQSETSSPRELSDWIQNRDLSIRRLLRGKARRWLVASEERADWEEAQIATEVLLYLDPTNEETLRLLLKTRAKAGGYLDLESALNDFSVGREEATGTPWQPSDETQSLIERIRSEATLPQTNRILKSRPPVREPPLFGREKEHKLLRRTLATPPHQALRGILIMGEAGIGKTRLIRESLVGFGVDGQSVYSAGAAELERLIPLNPLIEAFKGSRAGEVLSHLEDPWRAVLYGVMPRHYKGTGPVPQAPQIQPGSVPRRLFEAFHQLLLSLVDDEPVLLVIEDLQWADETTLAVLDFLVRRWDQGRFQFLFSLRSEEANRNTALRSFLDTLRGHEDFLEVPLGDLTSVAASTLIQDLSERPLQGNEVTYLQSLAGGNPFFLIELTLEYLAGRVDQPIPPATFISIPLSIRQVLQRRLSRLSPETDQILGALSVHARPLKITGLEELAGVPTRDCMAGLDQLHEFRLIEARGTRVVIGHELIRQTVYQQMNSSRRAWLHERVARYLEASSDPPPVEDLAVHFHMAGADQEARFYSLKVATHAEESGAVAEALQFLQIAREHSEDPEVVAELIGRMGHLHYLHQNLEEATPLLEVASQRFRRQGYNSKALAPELERVDALGQTGRLPLRECLEELDRIKQEAEGLEEWGTYMRTLDVEAHLRDRSGDLEGVRRLIRDAERFSSLGGPDARSRAQALLALNIYFGDPEVAFRAAREAVRFAENTGDNHLFLHALNRQIVTLHYGGLLNTSEGKEALRQAEMRLSKCGDLILKFNIRLNTAVWHLETRNLDTAAVAFGAAAEVLRGSKAKKPYATLHLNLGELHLSTLDISRARACYLLLEKNLTPSSPEYFSGFLTAGLGLCALYEGDLQEARARETVLPPPSEFWTFDPTLVTVFSARMKARRGNYEEALALLLEVRNSVRPRFVTAWIRLALEECLISKKVNPKLATELAEEGLSLAQQLEIPSVFQDFQKFL